MPSKSTKKGKAKIKVGTLKRGKSEVGKKDLKKIKGGATHNYSSINYRDTLSAIRSSFPADISG
jgi:hypothetical protein